MVGSPLRGDGRVGGQRPWHLRDTGEVRGGVTVGASRWGHH